MNHFALTLWKNEELLYNDLCYSNGVIPHVEYITKHQAELIISLRNRVYPTISYTWERVWKVIGKKKNGWNLTQRFARSFFMTDNF